MYSWITQEIQTLNAERDGGDIDRRFIKLLEELGELSQAFLSVTSDFNSKRLFWDDFREEAIDTLIVAIDVALTPLDGFPVSPSAGLIPSFLSNSSTAHIADWGDIENRIISISKHIDTARSYYHQKKHLSFMGRMSRIVQSAADLAFNSADGLEREEIDEAVRLLVERKLAKWASQKSNNEQAKAA